MLDLIELNKEVYTLIFVQIFMCCLGGKIESLFKCPDAGVDIWNFIFVFHGLSNLLEFHDVEHREEYAFYL